ncbi:MAG: hypothetical protein AB7Q42_04700 [Acidimicrobiia bacterium]
MQTFSESPTESHSLARSASPEPSALERDDRTSLVRHVRGVETPVPGAWLLPPARVELGFGAFAPQARRQPVLRSSGALTVREDPLRSSLELEILLPDGIIWFLGQPIHIRSSNHAMSVWTIAGAVDGAAGKHAVAATLEYHGVFRNREAAWAHFEVAANIGAPRREQSFLRRRGRPATPIHVAGQLLPILDVA